MVCALVLGAIVLGAPPSAVSALPRPVLSADQPIRPDPVPRAPWSWPLEPRPEITRPFRAPASRYAAGHRGIDMRTAESEAVLAPSAGVVSFAGMVAGRPVLSITHPGSLISSAEPVVASVRVGDAVERGQPVGTVASGGHCSARCLHFGVRLNGEYVSPLVFLTGIPRAVLLPPRDG